MIKIRIDKPTRCRGDCSLYLSFNYDFSIISKIKSYPVRYYDPNTKEWELPYKDLSYIKSDFKDYLMSFENEDKDTNDKVKSRSIDSKSALKTDLTKYNFKTKAYSYQNEGVSYGLTNNRWLLADEQGLGKTLQTIYIACVKKREEHYKHCLIICGVNGLKWNWKSEIAKHSHESGHILGYRSDTKAISNKDKIYDLKHLKEIDDYFIITNVESLRSKEVLDLLCKLCSKKEINMIAVDEVHKCKTPTSQQGKALLKLDAEYKLAMTGTPIMNNPLDLFIILKWLGYESHAFYAFKNHYCIMGGFGGYEVMGYKNMNEIRAYLDTMMLRRLKDEVLDLPEKTYVDEIVEMTPTQSIIYSDVKNQLMANIDQIKASPNPLTQMIRLRQATGYTGILSSTIQESAKMDRMMELVEESISNGRKVVIFSNWTQITGVAYELLRAKYNGEIITGEMHERDRERAKENFQNGDAKFLIGTIGAMGTGLTLTAGSVEIFLDEPWNRALKDQAVDRCHRIGQKNNLTIYTLITKNTLDEKIHELVYTKGLTSDIIIDNMSINDRKELVDMLLM